VLPVASPFPSLPPILTQLHARCSALARARRLLTRHDDALAARRHALAHAAEHFRSAYATRGLLAPLQPSVAGASKCGQAAAQAPLVRSLFKLLATADGEGAAAARAGARDGLRAAACSQLPMEALVEPAIEALERALEEASRLPAAGELAVVESALTCLLLALSRSVRACGEDSCPPRQAGRQRERAGDLSRMLPISSVHPSIHRPACALLALLAPRLALRAGTNGARPSLIGSQSSPR
jgi:hypothetical protein